MIVFIYIYCAIALFIAIMATLVFIQNRKKNNEAVFSSKDWKFYAARDGDLFELLATCFFSAPLWGGLAIFHFFGLLRDYIEERIWRADYGFRKDDHRLYKKLTKKWTKATTRNLRRSNSGNRSASILIKSLRLISSEKLYQYEFKSLLVALDRCSKNEDFESVYANCRNEEDDAVSKRLEEEKEQIATEMGAQTMCITWDQSVFEERFVVVSKSLRESLRNFHQKTRRWIKKALEEIDDSEVMLPIEGVIEAIENAEGVEQYERCDKRLVYRFDREYDKIVMISLDLR